MEKQIMYVLIIQQTPRRETEFLNWDLRILYFTKILLEFIFKFSKIFYSNRNTETDLFQEKSKWWRLIFMENFCTFLFHSSDDLIKFSI